MKRRYHNSSWKMAHIRITRTELFRPSHRSSSDSFGDHKMRRISHSVSCFVAFINQSNMSRRQRKRNTVWYTSCCFSSCGVFRRSWLKSTAHWVKIRWWCVQRNTRMKLVLPDPLCMKLELVQSYFKLKFQNLSACFIFWPLRLCNHHLCRRY